MAGDASEAISNMHQHQAGGVLLFGLLIESIARSKGRSFIKWFLLGSFFTIFALIAVCASKKQAEKSEPPEDKIEPDIVIQG